MKQSIFVGMTVIAMMMVLAVGMPSFGSETKAMMKSDKGTMKAEKQEFGPGQDDEGFRGKGHHGFRGELGRFFYKELNLTSEQKTKLRELRKESREAKQDTRSAVREIRDQKLQMLLSGKLDKTKLAELDKNLLKFHSQLEEEHLKMQRERLAILTPDQLKRLGEFLKQKRDEFRARREARKERGPNADRK